MKRLLFYEFKLMNKTYTLLTEEKLVEATQVTKKV